MFNNFWCWNYHFFPLVVPLIQSSTFILNSRGLNILFNRQNELGNITWSSHVMCVTCTLRKSLDRSVLESFAKAEKLTSVKPRWILRWKNSNLHKSISTSTFHFEIFIISYFQAENGHFWTFLYKNIFKNDYFCLKC